MLRRSVVHLASRNSITRVPLRTTSQTPSYLSSRRSFLASPKNDPQKLNLGNPAKEPQSRLPKILAGGIALGSAFMAAYYYVFLDGYLSKKQQTISEYTEARLGNNNKQTFLEQQKTHRASEISKSISGQESNLTSSYTDHAKQDVETRSDLSDTENSITNELDKKIQAEEDMAGRIPEIVNTVEGIDDVTSKPYEESTDLKSSPEVKPDEEPVKAIEITPSLVTSEGNTHVDIEIKSVPREQTTIHDMQEGDDGAQKSDSLLVDYHLRDKSVEHDGSTSEKLEDISSRSEDVDDGYITKDGKLILDFLQAIHAAEERQADLDFRTFTLEKRAMKEKYEKELKDARVRELMYAEREAILDKELTKERVRAAAAFKSLEENLEEKLRSELEEKEIEVEQKLKQICDIAKAELAAAVASEKASQIEKMAEANLNISALCMAFYARSEEARQSHSVHKLALGALALEDALSKGRPIQKEIEALHSHLEGIDKDSLIPLVLSSLPEDIQKHGTDTLSQLNHKFDALKGTLRHFSLIPPGGGGILLHSLAYIASWLKVKEVDESGDGIESLINRVDSLLAQGKLCEAADTLENGVKGSQATDVVDEWVRRARERAIAEQALTVLQSYATSVSLA